MIVDKSIVIKDCDVDRELSSTVITVYGCGNYASLFCERHEGKIEIGSFIVTDKKENERFRNKPVYSVTEFLGQRKKETIVICSRYYWMEMSHLLSEFGLKGGVDYFVWDYNYSENIKCYVAYGKEHGNTYHGDHVILIPIEASYDGQTILFKYCIDLFAKKFHARPVGYIRELGNPFEGWIFPSVKDLYESIGVKETVTIAADDEIVEAEFQRIISDVRTMNDWQNIQILDLPCGISFLRDYQRQSELDCNPHSESIQRCLRYAIRTVFFWKTYFQRNTVDVVVLCDGVNNESYLRDIAIGSGAKTYILNPREISKPFMNYSQSPTYCRLKEFFSLLSMEEKTIGIAWAKKAIKKIQMGENGAFMSYRGGLKNLFASNEKLNFEKNEDGAIKILICPHIFNEDPWEHGNQLCGNNYISWLEFLGDVSKKTPYSWYIKMHPDEKKRGRMYIENFVKRYSNIRLIDAQVSPVELYKSGFRYAVTIAGSIGHEYPLIGIDVVNSGDNPHMAFDFNINPKSQAELLDVLLHLQDYSRLQYADQIYEFYAVYYLYYRGHNFSEEFQNIFQHINFLDYQKDTEHTIYRTYIDKYSGEIHETRTKEKLGKLLDEVDRWRQGVFYKKTNSEIEKLLRSVES